MSAPVRVVIYCRVSTRAQRLAPQLRRCRLYCEARGWTIAAVHRDRRSGKRGTSRPGWDSARAVIRRRHASVLVAVALDRLGRSAVEVLQAVEACREVGASVATVRDGIDTTGPAGRMVVAVLAAVAELERELIAERTRAGLVAAASRGRRPGRRSRAEVAEVVAQVLAGVPELEAARSVGVSRETVARWVSAATKKGGRKQ